MRWVKILNERFPEGVVLKGIFKLNAILHASQKNVQKNVFKKKISAVKILALFNGTIFIHNVVLAKWGFGFQIFLTCALQVMFGIFTFIFLDNSVPGAAPKVENENMSDCEDRDNDCEDNGQNDSEVEVENFNDDADFSQDREFPEMETE